jgi:2'-5' RNA ligase
VAVEIDAAVAERLAALSAELQRRARKAAPRARVTWIPCDRLHLTVRFIGEVEAAEAAAISAVLGPPLEMEAFTLGFGGAGAFPTSGRPRTLWVGITEGVDALARVERDVSARLAACGVPREERPFTPHLTLARVRDAAGLRAAPLFDGIDADALGTMSVDAITLFESRLSPSGPTYVPLHRTTLGS